MNKYKTAAYEVKSEIDGLIEESSLQNKPWQLLDYKIMSRTLLATYEELNRIYKAKASERLGFEVSNDLVYLPNLFIKLSGTHEFITDISLGDEQDLNSPMTMFNSISDFNKHDIANIESKQYQIKSLMTSDGLLDKDKVLESPFFKYKFLKREYQDIIIDKINYVISERNNLFLEHASGTPLEIAYALLTVDQNIIGMFNNFDFMYEVPKVIIKNEDKAAFSNNQAYVLALLNQLSYDIVIISENGYADVENVIKESNYSSYYGKQKTNKELKKVIPVKNDTPDKNKAFWIAALAAVLLFAGGVIYSNISLDRKIIASQNKVVTAGVNTGTRSAQSGGGTISSVPRNSMKIVSVTPSGPLKEGVETEFRVVVEYDFTGHENLAIDIGVNDGKTTSGNFFTRDIPTNQAKVEDRFYVKSSIPLTKDKLKGKYTIGFKATPVKWDNHEFQVLVGIKNMSIQDTKRIINRDAYTFQVNK